MKRETICHYFAGRKLEILVEPGKAPSDAFIPQTHQPRHEAEVGFGDVAVRVAGELAPYYVFSFRLSYSARPSTACWPRPTRKPSSKVFHALRTLGGVPQSEVSYDNLKASVARALG